MTDGDVGSGSWFDLFLTSAESGVWMSVQKNAEIIAAIKITSAVRMAIEITSKAT